MAFQTDKGEEGGPDVIEIDGSQGEGGGQILRTSMSLSACLGLPICVREIRAGRVASGLRAQHLAAAQAIAQVCGTSMEDLSVGQQNLTLEPRAVQAGKYTFDVGTAGSTCLILQTIAIPLALASGPSTVEISGGTHNPKAPCFEYLRYVWAPFMNRIGLPMRIEMPRAGFYPKGGGLLIAHIAGGAKPEQLRSVNLTQRGELKQMMGVVKIANQPMSVGYRLRKAALWQLSRRGQGTLEFDIQVVEALDPAGLCIAWAEFENTQAAFFGVSSKAKSPEGAGCDAANGLADYLDKEKGAGGTLDPFAADQLMVPLALAPAPSRFTTTQITEHLLTNAEVIRQITGRSVKIQGEEDKPGTIEIGT